MRLLVRPAAVAVLVLVAAGEVAAAPPVVPHQLPVDAPVVRVFEPPTEPWGTGHRGVDLEVAVGTAVHASASGVVAFADVVAGQRWVTIDHPDGTRTSYGPLGRVLVGRGRVAAGQPLGTTTGGHDPIRTVVHWGARRDGRYVDPLSLLTERRWRPALVGPGDEAVTDVPVVPTYAPWTGRSGIGGALGLVQVSPEAIAPGWVLAPNPNHVIGVAGLGSHSGRVPLDLEHLGYDLSDVTYLSYAGRRDDPGSADDPRRDQASYAAEDTFAGVEAAAARLRDQLRRQQERAPGQAVDLVGHSMGGLVVLHYLLTMHDPAAPDLPPVDHVVTLASPLEGADLATAVVDAHRSATVSAVLDAAAPRLGLPTSDAPSLADLEVGSPLVQQLADAWAAALADPWSSPLATGTRVLTVGGSRDVVVPEHRSDLEGASHVVLPGGHDGLRRTEAARLVVRAFLTDEPVPGGPGGLGHWLSHPLGWAQRIAGEVVGGPEGW